MKKNIVFFWLLLGGVTIYGQTGNPDTKKNILVIHSSFGVSAPILTNLNNELTPGGYLPLQKAYFSRGGGFYITFPKTGITTLFNFITYSGTKREDNKSTWARGTSVGTSLGYSIPPGNSIQLIPFAGVLYSFFGVRATADLPDNTDFSDYFRSSSTQHHASTNQFLLNYGIHIAKTNFGKSALSQRIVAGIRIGYQSSLSKPKWSVNKTRLTDGPGINSGGFYAQVIIGLLQ